MQKNIDIWHEVPLAPQLTGMSCWAAAAAMLVGWRDCVHLRADEIAMGAGYWEAYQDGLEPDNIRSLSKHWKLHPLEQMALNFANLKNLLTEFGPLWIGEASPGLHSIVITGLYGDGGATTTYVRINDPWPIGRGERYSKTLAELQRDFTAATNSVGNHTQILHCGGRKTFRYSRSNSAYNLPVPSQENQKVYGGASTCFDDPKTESVINSGAYEIPNEFSRNLTGYKYDIRMYAWSSLPRNTEFLDITLAKIKTPYSACSPQNEMINTNLRRHISALTEKNIRPLFVVVFQDILHHHDDNYQDDNYQDDNYQDDKNLSASGNIENFAINESLDWLYRNVLDAQQNDIGISNIFQLYF